MAKCACRCGLDLPPRDKRHPERKPRFIVGHWSRTRAAKQIKRRSEPPPNWDVPSGACRCGCGGKTPIAKQTRRERDQYVGYPIRFMPRHHIPQEGAASSRWKGGRCIDGFGYIQIYTGPNIYALEHRMVWEKAYGPIPKGDIIHHINGDRADNRLVNLECMTRAQHKAHHATEEGSYHQRMSDTEMVIAYRKLWLRIGRPPLAKECTPANGTPGGATYCRRFGSLKKVRQLAYS